MFVLTHCLVNSEVLKTRKLNPEQEALLLLGGIMPDISTFDIVSTKRTHVEDGLKFLKSLNKKYKYLGVGFILHGEKPRGVDYYIHNPRGYINQKNKQILGVIKHYKKVFPKKTNFNDIAHLIIEFCFEHLTTQKNPWIIKKVEKAIKNKIAPKAVYNVANFFNINNKNTKGILKIRKMRIIERLINNFETIKGTAHNFQHFLFWKNIHDKSKQPSFLERLTQSSYGFLKTRFKEKQFEQMFARCVEIVRKDYDPFLDKVIKNIKKMTQEHRL